MVLEAIYHSTDSEYCHAIDENTIVLRLRVKKGDIKKCSVFYGDRVYPKEMVRMESQEMDITASDRLFDYFQVRIHTQLTRICYYFILFDGNSSIYYYGYDFHETLSSSRNLYFQFPYVRKEDIADVPEWAAKAIIYQIFPDSFASSENCISGKGSEVISTGGISCQSKLGGTLRGIIENMQYIADLGANCLYLTPIFAAKSYHKYNTVDYYTIDPNFGDLQTFRELVSKCHEAGIRVILDGVFNHSGADFFAFRDVMEKGEASEYKDWYFVKDFPVRYEQNPNYICFAYEKSMPKLNTGNREVIEYFKNVGTYWIREAGIDGWRLDVANEINHDFWREFRKAVKAAKPDAFLLGEIWHDSREWLQGDQFDSVMNYGFMYACIDFFAKGITNVEQFDERINYLRMRYKENVQYVQMNLLDTHDTVRFLSHACEDIRKLKVAALYMMTYIGVPNVYYGDEKGIAGVSDSDYRRTMVWCDNEDTIDIHDYYKKLISIRKEYMELMLGDYVTLETDICKNTYIYKREKDGEKLIIAINNSEQPVGIEVETGGNASEVTDLLGGKVYPVDGSKARIELEGISGVIIKV